MSVDADEANAQEQHCASETSRDPPEGHASRFTDSTSRSPSSRATGSVNSSSCIGQNRPWRAAHSAAIAAGNESARDCERANCVTQATEAC
jgi:hypothetical protein